MVDKNEVDVVVETETLSNRPINISVVIKASFIVTGLVLPGHVMHQRLAIRIGLYTEGPVAVPVRSHLLPVKGLRQAYHRLHRVHHVFTKFGAGGMKVDHTHRAPIAVPWTALRRHLARRRRIVTQPLLVFRRRAVVLTLGRRR